MGRELTKIVYKPSVESNEEFMVIVNPEEVRFYTIGRAICMDGRLKCSYVYDPGAQYKRWKEGGASVRTPELRQIRAATDGGSFVLHRHVSAPGCL